MDPIVTARLKLRAAEADDREQLLELFGNEEVMRAFSEPLTGAAAEKRFTAMVELSNSLQCAEQPIIELASGEIVGYGGAAWYTFTSTELSYFNADELERFEGPKLELNLAVRPDKQNDDYATEAGLALVDIWKSTIGGDLLARVERWNKGAHIVIKRIGAFDVAKRYQVEGGDLTFVYRMEAPKVEGARR